MTKIDSGVFENQIIHESSTEMLEYMETDSVDSVITDVPYGFINRDDNGLRDLDKGDADVVEFDLGEMVKEMIRVSSDNVYVFCSHQQMSYIYKIFEEQLSTRLLTWKKTDPSPLNCQYVYLSDVETIVWGKHSGGTFNGNYVSSVIEFKSGKSDSHPTQKPVGLIEKLLEVCSEEGDLILDPFTGSGSIPLAAKKMGRRYIGIEINEEYVDLARGRISECESWLKENKDG